MIPVRHLLPPRHDRLDSRLNRVAAPVKLAVALSLVAVVVAVPRGAPLALGGVAGVLLAVTLTSRLPWRFVVLRVLVLEPVVLGGAALALSRPEGVALFAFLLAKSTLCLWTMVLLSAATPFGELLRVLQRIRVPALLVTTLSLMYRYLFVIVDEAQRMGRARACRTFVSGRARTWRASATVVSQLFIRSSERAERVYAAMRARGWE